LSAKPAICGEKSPPAQFLFEHNAWEI
jgi:hypothetical protein